MIEIGKIYGNEVKIRIDEINENYIIASVIEVDEFWSNPNRISLLCRNNDGHQIYSINFAVGQRLNFKKNGGKIEGAIGRLLPWFSLDVKYERFEHYR